MQCFFLAMFACMHSESPDGSTERVHRHVHSLLLVPLVCGLIFVRLVGATSSDGFLFLIFVCLMLYTALNRLQSFVHIFAYS